MKTILSILIFLAGFNLYSQDSLKINEIDILVNRINHSDLPVTRDTLHKSQPGLAMTTSLSMILHKGELLKYVNHVDTKMTNNGTTRQIITSSTFYYDHNKLIKVEEYGIQGTEKKEANWYYREGELVYQSSHDFPGRETLLLTLADAMLSQAIKQ